jgi:hypothetical protein
MIYTGAFSIDRKGGVKEIKNNLITSETIAEVRAKAEFLEYGYDKQEVEFTTYFSDLKINDIIKIYAPSYRIPKELNKDRFIVKNVKHYFKNGNIKTRIRAVRYD